MAMTVKGVDEIKRQPTVVAGSA
ncbi:MAG: hypothetical protein QOI00_589, partial [Chloroflexota bacterium]|nr:hypothetical protein [Chloroflexota bacterium]